VSVPAEIRKRKRRAGAVAMLGHASSFRAARRTKDWMRELREGDQA